ncbi:MAG: YARHG domain-containing protein [Ferruginibacter sp.]
MQRFTLIFLCIAVLSCNNNTAKDTAKDKTVAVTTPVIETTNPLLGYWVGFLGDNKLNLSLQQVNGKEISGKSIAAGNYRDIKGSIEENSDAYVIHMTEPGDDKYDGRFDFTIKKSGMVCSGSWVPNDKTMKEKIFTCSKKEFTYKPDAGLYPEASQKLLAEDDVANLIKSDLRLMRNSIYARHGYSFKMKDMRDEYDHEEWYIPVTTDVRNELTAIEKKNEVLLKRYEKYAADHYDDFGR